MGTWPDRSPGRTHETDRMGIARAVPVPKQATPYWGSNPTSSRTLRSSTRVYSLEMIDVASF
jgi:hypothetical protein